MHDLIWLSETQMRQIEPYLPLSHGVSRVAPLAYDEAGQKSLAAAGRRMRVPALFQRRFEQILVEAGRF
jgi:hypothetical protein